MLHLSSLTHRLLYKDYSKLTKLLSQTSKFRFNHSLLNYKLILLNYSLISLRAFNLLSTRLQLLLLILLKVLLNGKLPFKLLLQISKLLGTIFQLRLNYYGIRIKLLSILSIKTLLLLSIIINNKELLYLMN